MKSSALFFSVVIFIVLALFVSVSSAYKQEKQAFIIEHENDIAQQQPGPHDGKGSTTAYNFFSKAGNTKTVFRKRVLHPGSSIGYHLQKEDEIYYIISGKGTMKMNNDTFSVQAGDAILTRPGSWHGLEATDTNDLAIIVAYENH